MRFIVLLAILVSHLAATELAFARVTEGAADQTGWWDADAHVIYKVGGGHAWIKNPTKVEAAAVPKDAVKPAKRTFQRLPDPPYGRVTMGDNDQVIAVWYHQESGGYFFPESVKAFSGFLKKDCFHVAENLQAPTPFPAFARDMLDHWAIEHAADIAAAIEAKKATPRK